MDKRVSVRNVLAFAILGMVAVLFVVIFRNYRGDMPEAIIEALPQNVDLSLKKVDYTETRNGVRRWQLIADSADYSVKNATTHIENIHMTFFDKKGMDEATLTARNGEMHTEKRDVTASGDVVVRTVNGYDFFSDSLLFSESDRKIRTDDPVRIVSSQMKVSGEGLEFDVDSHKYLLRSKVRALITKSKGR